MYCNRCSCTITRYILDDDSTNCLLSKFVVADEINLKCIRKIFNQSTVVVVVVVVVVHCIIQLLYYLLEGTTCMKSQLTLSVLKHTFMRSNMYVYTHSRGKSFELIASFNPIHINSLVEMLIFMVFLLPLLLPQWLLLMSFLCVRACVCVCFFTFITSSIFHSYVQKKSKEEGTVI